MRFWGGKSNGFSLKKMKVYKNYDFYSDLVFNYTETLSLTNPVNYVDDIFILKTFKIFIQKLQY